MTTLQEALEQIKDSSNYAADDDGRYACAKKRCQISKLVARVRL